MPQFTPNNPTISPLSMTAAGLIFDDTGRILLIKENYGKRRYSPRCGSNCSQEGGF